MFESVRNGAVKTQPDSLGQLGSSRPYLRVVKAVQIEVDRVVENLQQVGHRRYIYNNLMSMNKKSFSIFTKMFT